MTLNLSDQDLVRKGRRKIQRCHFSLRHAFYLLAAETGHGLLMHCASDSLPCLPLALAVWVTPTWSIILAFRLAGPSPLPMGTVVYFCRSQPVCPRIESLLHDAVPNMLHCLSFHPKLLSFLMLTAAAGMPVVSFCYICVAQPPAWPCAGWVGGSSAF